MAQYEVSCTFYIKTDDPQKASDMVGEIIAYGWADNPNLDDDDWEMIICKPELYKEEE